MTFSDASGTMVECQAWTEGSGGSVGVEATAACLEADTTVCPLAGTTVVGAFNRGGTFVLE